MAALRFLVVEGNTRPARERHAESYGLTPAASYAAVLQEIEPGILCDIALPADEGANLPDAAGLESYDGVVLTGSALNIYDATHADGVRVAHAGLRLVLGHPGRSGRGGGGRGPQSAGARGGVLPAHWARPRP